MAHATYMPEQHSPDDFYRPLNLEPDAAHGRMTDTKTGDVWPIRDTGFRMTTRVVLKPAPTPPPMGGDTGRLICTFSDYINTQKHLGRKPDPSYREIYMAFRAAINRRLGGAHA